MDKEYRGFSLHFWQKPIPDRSHDYEAVHKEYSGEEADLYFTGSSVDDIKKQVDAWHEDNKGESYATECEGGWAVIIGTACSSRYCSEHGCVFPSCASLGDLFETKDELLKAHPKAEFV